MIVEVTCAMQLGARGLITGMQLMVEGGRAVGDAFGMKDDIHNGTGDGDTINDDTCEEGVTYDKMRILVMRGGC